MTLLRRKFDTLVIGAGGGGLRAFYLITGIGICMTP
jgi:succinate dehydrogenase/fumarate reductase flavoprotein subunit